MSGTKRVGSVLLALIMWWGLIVPLQAQTARPDTLPATDLVGDWQVVFSGAADGTRIVFRISKAPAGFRAIVYWADQSHYAASVPTVTLQGSTVSFTATASDLNGSFIGTLGANRASIEGKWTQGASGANGFPSQMLVMARAAKGTAWEIRPALGSDAKLIAANLDPTFEVATVKPHDPKVMGGGWRWIGARRFEATMPVGALIADIYGLQREQIIGAPDWGLQGRLRLCGGTGPARLANARSEIQHGAKTT